jgi:hypothetical protein
MKTGLPSADTLRARLVLLLLARHFRQAGNWLNIFDLTTSHPPMYLVNCSPEAAGVLAAELHRVTGQLFSSSQSSWVLFGAEVRRIMQATQPIAKERDN